MSVGLKTAIGFLSAAVLAVLLLIAVVFGALIWQPQWLVPPLERGLELLLDRAVEIGELSAVDLGADVALAARDIRIGNPPWSEAPDLLKLGRVRLRMDLRSLWRDGPLIIHELELVELRMTLLAPGDQPPNWRFGPDEQIEAPPVGENGEASLRLPLIMHQTRIENAALLFRDPDQEVRLQVDSMDIRDPGSDGLIAVRLAGTLNGIDVFGQGEVGPGPALLSGRNLELNLDLEWGEVTFQADGHIGHLASLSELDLWFLLATPHARPLLDVLGMPEIRDGALHLEGQVKSAAQGLSWEAEGTLDEFELQLSGSAGSPMLLDDLVLNLAAQGPSLREAGAVFDLGNLPVVPFALKSTLLRGGDILEIHDGEVRVGSSRLVFDGRLPKFPELDDWHFVVKGSDLDLRLLGPVLGLADLPSQPFQLLGSLSASDVGVEVLEMQLTGPEGRVLLNGRLGEPPGYEGSRFRLEASGDDLSASGAWLGLDKLPAETFQLTGELLFTRQGWQLSGGRFSAAEFALELEGSADSINQPTDLRATFSATTPDLAQTLQNFGMAEESLGRFPLSVHGRVEGAPRALRLMDASIESGEARGRVRGELGDLAELKGLALSLEVAGPDLASFLADSGAISPAVLPFSLKGDIARTPAGWEAKRVVGRVSQAQVQLDGRFAAAAGLSGAAVTFSAYGEDLGEILAPWTAWPFPAEPFAAGLTLSYESGLVRIPELSARIGGLELGGQMSLGAAPEFSGTEGIVRLFGPSTQALLRLLNLNLDVPDSAVAASLRIAGGKNALRLDDIQVSLGESDLSGNISLRVLQGGDVPEVHADLQSDTLYLPFLIPDLDEPDAEDSRMASTAPSPQGQARVIPDTPVGFGWIHRVNGRFRYQVGQVVVREDISSRAEFDIAMRDGVLTAPRIAWEGSFSTGEAAVRVQALEQGGNVDIYLDTRRIPLVWLLAGEPDTLTDRSYRLRLSARGDSLRSLAESANGALVYEGGGARISNNGLHLILGDLLGQVFAQLNPWAESDSYTQVVCGAGAMTIEDGVVYVMPGLVLRTDKLDIASAGTLDLHDERLDLDFSTRSRKGIGISAAKAITPYLKIGGTLANPRLTLDSKGAAVSGGAAVATAGLSIIAGGLWDRWIATAGNPCERLFTRASEDTREEFRALLKAPEFSTAIKPVSP